LPPSERDAAVPPARRLPSRLSPSKFNFACLALCCATRILILTFRRKLSEEDRAALGNEIDILKQVDHPNIVKCYDIYEDEKYIYIVMELLQGGELFDQILKKEKFSEKEARDVVAPIFDALAYCH
jgi:serine/threonine protein kinase